MCFVTLRLGKNTSFSYKGRCLKRFHLEDETKTRGSMSSKTMHTLIKNKSRGDY